MLSLPLCVTSQTSRDPPAASPRWFRARPSTTQPGLESRWCCRAFLPSFSSFLFFLPFLPSFSSFFLHLCTHMHMILLTYRVCASTPKGFEPLRAEPNGFLIHLLNHSDTVSSAASLQSAPEPSPMLHIIPQCLLCRRPSLTVDTFLAFSLSQPLSLPPRCASTSSSRGYGATAARLTPDQKVGGSSLSGLILFLPELFLSGFPQPELWPMDF